VPFEPAGGSLGYGNGWPNGGGNGHARRAATNGNGNGHRPVDARTDWLESGLRLVDDDVHVVVYRSDEIDTSGLTSAPG
jgi:hypothetical protein